jgi:hypothetical protein
VTTAIRTLHLTNGSAIIPKMHEAGIEGTILAWNDLLHEGPVPFGLGTAALRDLRADFLASCGWGSRDDIERELHDRDKVLDNAVGHPEPKAPPLPVRTDEIVLWFEHDLYDQLQLIQILDRLPVDGGVRLTAVVPATYLGHVPASDYPSLLTNRRVLTSAEQLAARDAWQAFRSADPCDIVAALPRVTVLPHLAPALRRHLEQFPSVANGLSRTEQQTLEVVAAGTTRLRDVFERTNGREEAFFMGDAGFLFHISSLIQNTRPLLRIRTPSTFEPGTLQPRTLEPRTLEPWNPETLELSLELTSDGERVLRGELDRVSHCGIDRWLGGVHVEGHGPVWRWDQQRQTLRLV